MDSNSKKRPSHYDFGLSVLQGATFEGRYDFPRTPGILVNAEKLEGVSYDHISDRDLPENAVLNFYTHDERFRGFVEKPDSKRKLLERFSLIIGVDASVYRTLPLSEQIHSLAINRRMDWYFYSIGKPCVPHVSWGDWRTYDFFCDGVEPKKTIAVSTLGACRGKREKLYFLEGLKIAVEKLSPPSIVFHGRIFTQAREMLDLAGVRIIPMASRIDKAYGREVQHGTR